MLIGRLMVKSPLPEGDRPRARAWQPPIRQMWRP